MGQERKKTQRLEEAALRLLVEREQTGPEAVVLRLAWLEGLTREEIANLTWSQVSFLDGRLELPDRAVPLDPELRTMLWRLQEAHSEASPYVVLSARSRTPLRPESISRLARQALDRGGLAGVRLLDLRYDWILRQLETLDWPEAARLSGMEVASLQIRFSGGVPAADDAERRRKNRGKKVSAADQIDEFKLWKVLQAERGTPAGLALWLAWQLGLQAREMTALTWDQIDWEGDRVRLPDREVVLSSTVRRLLEEERRSRAPSDDPHVLLTERSRRPIDLPRLSRMTRAALIRGGMERTALRDLRRNEGRDSGDALILQQALNAGAVSRGEVSRLLGLSKTAAYHRLRRLTERKRLVRVGGKYYLPGTVVPPERHLETVRAYLEREGFAYRQDVAALLHIQPKQCGLLLRHMVEAGQLLQRGQRYVLPGLAGERKAE